ncbi:MAG: hypothetical protein R2716_13680 [Microthrixaceae bacterium]
MTPRPLANPFVHEELAGATQSTGWLDAWTSQVSPYASRTVGPGHRRRGGLRPRAPGVRLLVVKGIRHDYLGRNNAADSLLVWTHHMRNINAPQLRPRRGAGGNRGCPP